jgi:predicted metal-dependent hydrolase
VPFLDLGPARVQYEVVRGSSRRYTYFRFRPDAVLEVVIPRGRQVNVEGAIRERTRWLLREFERLSKTRNVLDRDMIMFDGALFRVSFSEGENEGIEFDTQMGVADVQASDRKRLRELVRRKFLRESSAYVVRRVAQLSPVVGKRPSRVDVREIAKWGYCTRGGRLSFSWQLIALPERLREYVVLHELTHLLEFNHSAAFKRKLGAVCPDFRERERELDRIAPYDRLSPP